MSSHSIVTASVSDAADLAELYREVYRGPPGQPPGCGYPFPQYMNSEWFAERLAAEDFCWLGARVGNRLVGCVGAVRDVGSGRGGDRIAELTGLVVRKEWRQLGIGGALLQAMGDRLSDQAEVILAETRTGNLGGWKSTLKAGFVPWGFEPLAHNMLGTPEPMIVMGRLSRSALQSRRLDYRPSPSAHRLGTLCLRALRLAMAAGAEVAVPCADRASPPSESGRSAASGRWDERYGAAAVAPQRSAPLSVTEIEPGFAEPSWLGPEGLCDHRCGVVGLRRIVGSDYGEVRFLRKRFLLSSDTESLGLASVSLDTQDRRARLLGLRVRAPGLLMPFLRQITAQLRGTPAQPALAVIVLDVRADFPDLHAGLEALGFFPTVYYPSLIATDAGRVDAVQFTLVCQGEPGTEAGLPSGLDAETLQIARVVLSSRPRGSEGYLPGRT